MVADEVDLPKEIVVNAPANSRKTAVDTVPGTAARYLKRDFWSTENLKFAQPHFRLAKSARIINRLARGKECTLLDVGCGPATLSRLLASNIHYHGLDIAIRDPAPNLIEADFLESPIEFREQRFDIVVAQGIFEYMGSLQSVKLAEITRILNEAGIFIVSYWNFGHRNREIYWPFSNVQSLPDFRQDLARYFYIHRCSPVSHNWRQSSPRRKLSRAVNMCISRTIPVISPKLAVEYFFLCSSRGPAN